MSEPVYVWVDRDKYGSLFMQRNNETLVNGFTCFSIDNKLFPQVTHENSPVKFALVNADVFEMVIKTLKYYADDQYGFAAEYTNPFKAKEALNELRREG